MNLTYGPKYLAPVLTLILAALACNMTAGQPTTVRAPELPVNVDISPTPPAPPSPTPENLEPSTFQPSTDSLWATRSFAEPETAADPDMADGKPDVVECGDSLRAWAPPASPDPLVLTLTYAAPLLATQVNIIQSGNPGGILRVEVLDSASGLGQLIYNGEQPFDGAQGKPAGTGCPETLSLPVKTDSAVDTVIITVAASETPTQIDAVELVGSLPAFVDLPVFWQASIPSENPPEKFGLPGGLAADNQGKFHLADGAHGIYTYDVEGNQLKTLPGPQHSNLTDVTSDAFGNIIITDSGYGWFIVLSPEGAQIVAGGEDFDDDGPFAVAVSPQDGNLYLRDKTRIRVYTSDTAQFLRDLPLESGAYYGMAFDAAGNLYLAEQYSASVHKLNPSNGEIIDTLGVPALAKTTPRDLALDEAGNIYVLVNSSPGNAAVYMLDPQGNLLKRFGRLVYANDERQEGTLFDPISLAVTPDGRFLVICDAGENVTYLTAFNIMD